MDAQYLKLAAAILTAVCLAGCSGSSASPGGSQSGSAPSSGFAAGLPQLATLNSLQNADTAGSIRRVPSDLDYELLDGAPVALSASPQAQWSAGSLQLSPAGTSTAWAIFGLPGMNADGTAVPLSLAVSADAAYWLAVSDYSTGRWRFLSYSAAGDYTLANGAALISPSGSFYVALIAWQSPSSFSSLQLTTNETPLPETDPPVGMCLENVVNFAASWPFVDIMKSADPWMSTTTGGQPNATPLDLDAQGWVKSLAAGQTATTVVLKQQQGNYPAGQYILLYDGSGTIQVLGDGQVDSQTPGRMVLSINPGSNGNRTGIRITSSDPADYVRNIRLVMPEHESDYATQVFDPEFLSRLAPFRLLYFHNWQRATNETFTQWSERTPKDYMTQAMPNGVAPEYIIDLCNLLNTDCWLCIPHLVDDDYLTQMATLFRDNLNPGLRVYLEHSNECWNNTFTQSIWCQQQGLAANLSDDPFTAQIRWHSQRSVHIFSVWEQVFGGTSRLVRVMGAEQTDPFTITEALDWQDAWQSCDILATGVFIGGRLGAPPNADATKLMSVDDVLAEMELDVVQNNSFTATNAALLQGYPGLRLVCYSGGPALYAQGAYANDPVLDALFTACNHDPGMKQVYLDILNGWHDNGGGMFLHWTFASPYNASGTWGCFETQTQATDAAPKYEALVEYQAQF